MNKFEEYKKTKQPLSIIDDIEGYAKTGFDSILPEHFDLFKWAGVYQQRPRDGHFMMRIKVNGGRITSEQLRAIASIAKDYGHGITDITTRQAFQVHWLTIEQIPDVFHRLEAVGLTSIGACGDILRNVTACPVAGIDHDEVFDVRPTVDIIDRHFYKNEEFSNLPRKFKITVVACSVQCTKPQINDLALVGVKNHKGDNGYQLYLGGGLSSNPKFAKNIGVFIPVDKALEAAIAVAKIYRDAPELREKRNHARLKFLVDDKGVDFVRAEFIRNLGWTPEQAEEIPLAEDEFRDHVGTHRQAQDGLSWIGVCVLTGRITDAQAFAAADIAEKYGSGEIRTTNLQNFLIPNIPDAQIPLAQKALKSAGFEYEVPSIRRGAIVCTGIEFCNLAIVETKQRMKELIGYLEKNIKVDDSIKINMNGCPNSCAHHHIGEIGLQGCIAKLPTGEKKHAFDIHLGGQLGPNARFTRAIHRKVPSKDLNAAVANIINKYTETKLEGERFSPWAHRHSDEELDAFLAVPTIPGPPELPMARIAK